MDGYKAHYKKKVVLITGGAGSIGSNLVRLMAKLEPRLIIVLDDLSSGFERNVLPVENVLFVNGSVTDEVVLKRVFNERPDMVFHLAAFFANQRSVDYPQHDLLINGLGTLLLLQYAQMHRVSRIVYASSGCSIYGSHAPLPLKEEFMSMYLSSPYQITKTLGELYANFFHKHYDLPVVKARLFNSFGPGETPGQYRNVIPNFVFWALSGKPLPITAAPNATRDFTYVDDIVDALLRAGYSESAIGKEMNIASGVESRIQDLAERINELTGNPAGLTQSRRRTWDDKDRLLADIALANELLGYQPQVDLDEGLRHTVDWFKENWEFVKENADFPPGRSAAL